MSVVAVPVQPVPKGTQGVVDLMLKTFANPTGNLTQQVTIVDENGRASSDKKHRFVLQSNGYLDIKAFLAAGLVFPSSAESFQGLHPKESLQKLIDLDAGIYQETQDAMVQVHKTCFEFNATAFPKFNMISLETQKCASYAVEQLTGNGELSLQGFLTTLTDGKSGAEELARAVKGATIILKRLSKDASDKAEKIDGLIQDIVVYSNRIQADKTKVDKVVEKFTPADKNKKGLAAKIDSELETLREQMRVAAEAAVQAAKDFDYNRTVADWTAAYIWIPWYGWISGGITLAVFRDKAAKALAEYEKNAKITAEKAKEAGAIQKVIEDVALLGNQNSTISGKMESAIIALQDIKGVFSGMSVDLSACANAMAEANDAVTGDLDERQIFLKDSVDKASQKWQQVFDAVNGLFETENNLQVGGITSNVEAPPIK